MVEICLAVCGNMTHASKQARVLYKFLFFFFLSFKYSTSAFSEFGLLVNILSKSNEWNVSYDWNVTLSEPELSSTDWIFYATCAYTQKQNIAI